MPLAPEAEETSLNDGDFDETLLNDIGKHLAPRSDIFQNHIQVLRLGNDITFLVTVPHTWYNRHAAFAIVARESLEVVDKMRVVTPGSNLDIQEQSV